MTGFTEKDINDRALSEILRSAREERGETLDDVERATRISKKYLAILEGGDISLLPDMIYARNFVRTLAKRYDLDAETLTRNLVHEVSAIVGKDFGASRPVNFVSGRTIAMTPNTFKGIGIAAGLIGVVGYFAFSVHQILKPPNIVLYTPKDNQVFVTRQVVLEGRTEPEVELSVNQESVLIEADGTFKDILTLPPGVSTLRIAGKKKHSKEHEIYVKVVVEEPMAVSSATGTVAAR